MNKYWFEFKLTINQKPPVGTLMGVGVTADTKEEAIEIIKLKVFERKNFPFPEIETIQENVQESDLDQFHVIPNMGNWLRKGIWFPLGY